MRCSCTENNRQSDMKEILTKKQDKKYNSMKHLKGKQFLFTVMYWEWRVSENPESWIKPFKPASPCLLEFSRWNSGKDIAQSFLFTTTRIIKYSSVRFLSSRGQKMSENVFKFCTKLDHCLKSLHVRKVTAGNARLHETRKQTSNAIIYRSSQG